MQAGEAAGPAIVPAAAKAITGITTANLRLRTGAGTKYKVINTLPKGTRVKLVRRNPTAGGRSPLGPGPGGSAART